MKQRWLVGKKVLAQFIAFIPVIMDPWQNQNFVWWEAKTPFLILPSKSRIKLKNKNYWSLKTFWKFEKNVKMVGQILAVSTLESSQRELDHLSYQEKKQMKLKSNLIFSLESWLDSFIEKKTSEIWITVVSIE